MTPEERKRVIAETTLEIQRLNWSIEHGRKFLMQRYGGKQSRAELSAGQLIDFLSYLKTRSEQ